MLDWQSGERYEGESAPVAEPSTALAIQAFNHLANGQGAIDWSGLPYVVAELGITDVSGLMHALLVIKTHKPPKED